jgi:hypothetical protein
MDTALANKEVPMVARRAPEPWQIDAVKAPHEWTVGDLKDAIREIGQEASWNAAYMDRERPYSSPPVARTPVWSDELRAESQRLRDEGLIAAGVLHPWEADPVAWPSQDPVVQADLLAQQQERDEWAQWAKEIGEEPVAFDNTHMPDMGGWRLLEPEDAPGISAEQVITAMDTIRNHGQGPHPDIEAGMRLTPAQERAYDNQPVEVSDTEQDAFEASVYDEGDTPFQTSDDLRAWLALQAHEDVLMHDPVAAEAHDRPRWGAAWEVEGRDGRRWERDPSTPAHAAVFRAVPAQDEALPEAQTLREFFAERRARREQDGMER